MYKLWNYLNLPRLITWATPCTLSVSICSCLHTSNPAAIPHFYESRHPIMHNCTPQMNVQTTRDATSPRFLESDSSPSPHVSSLSPESRCGGLESESSKIGSRVRLQSESKDSSPHLCKPPLFATPNHIGLRQVKKQDIGDYHLQAVHIYTASSIFQRYSTLTFHPHTVRSADYTDF